MKAAIHPSYNEVRVHCACSNTFMTRSTHKGDIGVEICSNCHPFFTGKQKLLDTAGRIDRFNKKYANSPKASDKPAKKEAAPVAQARKRGGSSQRRGGDLEGPRRPLAYFSRAATLLRPSSSRRTRRRPWFA